MCGVGASSRGLYYDCRLTNSELQDKFWVDKTKPLQALSVPWNFLSQPRLDPELMERVHMNVWHHRRTANHNTEQVWLTSARFKTRLLKVKRENTFPLKSMKEDK